MKKTLLLFSFLIIAAPTFSQTFNQEIVNTKGTANLTGKINFEKLNTAPYNKWFSENYDSYAPKEEIINAIKTDLQSYTITLFMGTWCGDSKREVPRFYKILNTCEFPIDRLTTVAVEADREHYKQSAGGEQEGLNIHRVPTFIFYKDGKEVNRIVESPKTSIEEDIKDILSGNYTPNYSGVTKMNTIIETLGTDYLSKNSENLVNEFSSISESLYELNTYANVLFFAGKEKEAVEILKFNTLLFPNEADAYVSLANKLVITENISDAIDIYERSLKLQKNEKINMKIKELKNSL
ncbi:thioredoxin domain-containing protein [uncultured Aquimarina sp.]|uniref:thioredoxin domain-containing protein n=1 Tax=uncultured Aquimarina sp. TaxID=575652 RepID=UPI0026351770|nr:thioredoxin domain-containing protein [uncultured Aquimarina sp.]